MSPKTRRSGGPGGSGSGGTRRARTRLIALCLIVALAASLSGCAATQQPENQAYALILSIDKTAAGLLELGISLPNLGNGSGAQEGGSPSGASDSTHENYFVIGSSFSEALDLLQAVVLRTLNLTQLKLIVVSQVAAQEPSFGNLVESLILTNHLYPTSRMIVTLGTAKDFLKEQAPTPGKRFSSTIESAIEHYSKVGYVIDNTLGDLYCLMNSIYGDPTLMLGSVDAPQSDDLTLPPGELGNALPGTLPSDSGWQHELMGAALFNHKQMVGVLTGAQTRWLAVLTDRIQSFNYICEGHFLELLLKRTPAVELDLSKSPIELTVTLDVVPIPMREMPDKQALRDMIVAELSELFSHCQSLGVDPFGYAELAAKRFPTVGAFEAFNWHEQFQAAQVNFNVNFVGNY